MGPGIHASPKFLGSSAESQGGSPPWDMSWSQLGAVCSPRPACHTSGQPQRRHHLEKTGGQAPEAAICLDISQEDGAQPTSHKGRHPLLKIVPFKEDWDTLSSSDFFFQWQAP